MVVVELFWVCLILYVLAGVGVRMGVDFPLQSALLLRTLHLGRDHAYGSKVPDTKSQDREAERCW